MTKFLRAAGQTILATLVFLFLLEVVFRTLEFPRGAVRFIERVVIQNQLSTLKPKGEFRIFAYGESSIHGAHYAPVSSPMKWLEAYLKDFLPGTSVKIVNFARMGHGTRFHYEAFRDTLDYKPDLVVFYSGHNEFLPGNQIDQQTEKSKQWNYGIREAVQNSRFISAVVRWVEVLRLRRSDSKKFEDRIGNASETVEAQPSGIGMENAVIKNTPYYWEHIEKFRDNFKKIFALAKEKNIPVMMFRPAGNLKDFFPSCSRHNDRFSEKDRQTWEALFEEGKKAQEAGDFSGALQFYENAASLDSDYAELTYRIAHLYLNQGNLIQAKVLFEKARDFDCLRARAPSDLLAVIDEFGYAGKAVVLDAEKITAAEAPGGIMGYPLIEDNVHFSIRGHALLGRVLAQEIADRDWIVPKFQWQFQKERSYEQIFQDLGITKELLVYAYLECAKYFGSKYESRIQMAKKALETIPDHPKALRQLAWSYWLKGDKPKALEIYQQLGKVNPAQLQEVFATQSEIKSALNP